MAQDERQRSLNMAFDALWDLADFLELPPGAISLRGTLAVAFGARGVGGRAAAHYEYARRVFNLTRERGAGFVAHEWTHALDHAVGVDGGANDVEDGEAICASGRDRLRAHTAKRMPDASAEIVRLTDAAMLDLVRSPVGLLETLAVLRGNEGRLRRQAAALGRQASGLDRGERGMTRQQCRISADAFHRKAIATSLRVVGIEEAGFSAQEPERRRSNYLGEAHLLDPRSGPYWSKPCELLARSAECAIADWLGARGRRSDYLVHSVGEDLHRDMGWRANPYPAGEERGRMECSTTAWLRGGARGVMDRRVGP